MSVLQGLSKHINKRNEMKRAKTGSGPLWKGPMVDGITCSMLNKFLVCRERFRIAYVLGLVPHPSWDHKMGYGTMWHLCEETLAGSPGLFDKVVIAKGKWAFPLEEHVTEMARAFPAQAKEIKHWGKVCEVQFPAYVDFWRKHPDVKMRTPFLQEKVFDVKYPLPSGRIIRLRGKYDAVDFIGRPKDRFAYLQENKVRGQVKPQILRRQLQFDLQTMLYLVSLKTGWPNEKVAGVRYNVVQRPLSGGAGSIRQHKPSKKNPKGETADEFYRRLGVIIRTQPQTFFLRWKVEVIKNDIENVQEDLPGPYSRTTL
jgi:hypothetical protein